MCRRILNDTATACTTLAAMAFLELLGASAQINTLVRLVSHPESQRLRSPRDLKFNKVILTTPSQLAAGAASSQPGFCNLKGF